MSSCRQQFLKSYELFTFDLLEERRKRDVAAVVADGRNRINCKAEVACFLGKGLQVDKDLALVA